LFMAKRLLAIMLFSSCPIAVQAPADSQTTFS